MFMVGKRVPTLRELAIRAINNKFPNAISSLPHDLREFSVEELKTKEQKLSFINQELRNIGLQEITRIEDLKYSNGEVAVGATLQSCILQGYCLNMLAKESSLVVKVEAVLILAAKYNLPVIWSILTESLDDFTILSKQTIESLLTLACAHDRRFVINTFFFSKNHSSQNMFCQELYLKILDVLRNTNFYALCQALINGHLTIGMPIWNHLPETDKASALRNFSYFLIRLRVKDSPTPKVYETIEYSLGALKRLEHVSSRVDYMFWACGVTLVILKGDRSYLTNKFNEVMFFFGEDDLVHLLLCCFSFAEIKEIYRSLSKKNNRVCIPPLSKMLQFSIHAEKSDVANHIYDELTIDQKRQINVIYQRQNASGSNAPIFTRFILRHSELQQDLIDPSSGKMTEFFYSSVHLYLKKRDYETIALLLPLMTDNQRELLAKKYSYDLALFHCATGNLTELERFHEIVCNHSNSMTYYNSLGNWPFLQKYLYVAGAFDLFTFKHIDSYTNIYLRSSWYVMGELLVKSIKNPDKPIDEKVFRFLWDRTDVTVQVTCIVLGYAQTYLTEEERNAFLAKNHKAIHNVSSLYRQGGLELVKYYYRYSFNHAVKPFFADISQFIQICIDACSDHIQEKLDEPKMMFMFVWLYRSIKLAVIFNKFEMIDAYWLAHKQSIHHAQCKRITDELFATINGNMFVFSIQCNQIKIAKVFWDNADHSQRIAMVKACCVYQLDEKLASNLFIGLNEIIDIVKAKYTHEDLGEIEQSEQADPPALDASDSNTRPNHNHRHYP